MSDEEVNGPLHPAADAEYLSAAANWLALAEEFASGSDERRHGLPTFSVSARLAELNIAMASACGGYQYRQRMEEQQRAFTQRVPVLPPQAYAPPVQPPSAPPCECCAEGLMSGRGETCDECGHGSAAHAAEDANAFVQVQREVTDTAPTPPEAACDQFVAPQPGVIAADHLCERCGASAAAHVRSIAQVQGGIPVQHVQAAPPTAGSTPVGETRAVVDSVRDMLCYLSNSQLREIMNMTSHRLGERGE